MYLIPVTNEPNQRFQCLVPVGKDTKIFDFELKYNSVAEYWVLSVTDADTDTRLITAMPLLTGEYPAANLLEQYDYLEIGVALIVAIGLKKGLEPNDETLSKNYFLVWGDKL